MLAGHHNALCSVLISSQAVNFRLLTWQANGHLGAPPPGALCSAGEVQGPSVPLWGARGHIFCSLGSTMRSHSAAPSLISPWEVLLFFWYSATPPKANREVANRILGVGFGLLNF